MNTFHEAAIKFTTPISHDKEPYRNPRQHKNSPPFPHTEETARTVQSPIKQVSTTIKQHQTQNWTNFTNNLNHLRKQQENFPSTQIQNKIKLTNSNITCSDHPRQHNSLTQQQANILVSHYANISYLPQSTYTRRQENPLTQPSSQRTHPPLCQHQPPSTCTRREQNYNTKEALPT